MTGLFHQRLFFLLLFLSLCLCVNGAECIVYASHASGNWELWKMELPGGRAEQLTQTFWEEQNPALSPDGKWLAYEDNRGRVSVMNTADKTVYEASLPEGKHLQPAWTPDSQKWVCSSFMEITKESANLLLVQDWQKKRCRTRIFTDKIGVESFPTFSPDGQSLAFSHFVIVPEEMKMPRKPVAEELYLMRVKTGEITALTQAGKNCTQPAYSPDGKSLLFSANLNAGYDLWLMPLDGKDEKMRPLTSDPGYEAYPAWSPDGSRIAFVSDRSGNQEIWTMDGNGQNWKQLAHTKDKQDSIQPCWGLWNP